MTLNTLSLSLQFGRFDGVAAHRAVLPRHKVTRWIRHALATDAEITVRIVGAEEGQQLNRLQFAVCRSGRKCLLECQLPGRSWGDAPLGVALLSWSL